MWRNSQVYKYRTREADVGLWSSLLAKWPASDATWQGDWSPCWPQDRILFPRNAPAAHTNFTRKCWVGRGVRGELLGTQARSKSTWLFPEPHEAAGEPGSDLCLLTENPKFHVVECQESSPISEQEKNMWCQIRPIWQNNSNDHNQHLEHVVLNALPVLFHLILKMMLRHHCWGSILLSRFLEEEIPLKRSVYVPQVMHLLRCEQGCPRLWNECPDSGFRGTDFDSV